MTDAPWRIKVGIGIPSAGEWKSAFGFALANMIGYFERCHAHLPDDRRPELSIICIDGHLPQVRHRIAATAVHEECTHLLWLDADMMFPADTLHRLLSHNLPAVGVNYPRRTYPHLPTAHRGGGAMEGVVWDEEGKSGVEEIKHVGFGVCLMDMRVFDAIDPPYFVMEPAGPSMLDVRGEDVYFFEKLKREADIPVYVDHDLSRMIGHVGEMVFNLHHANVARRAEAEAAAAGDENAMAAE